MKALRIIGAVLVVGVALLFGAAQIGNWSNADTAAQDTVGDSFTLEHKVAVVSAGTMVSDTDPRVNEARHYLQLASEHFGKTPEQIADMSAVAANLGHKEGLHVTALQVMEATTLANMSDDYPQAAAIYLGLRRDATHAEALIRMRALAQAFARVEK